MYHTWQRGLYPHIPFDTFLLELEKIGATHTMKAGPILDLLHELIADGQVTAGQPQALWVIFQEQRLQ